MAKRERQLIVALDVEPKRARALVRRIGAAGRYYKVAPSLHFQDPSLIAWLARAGKRVFLDCKWYDIPTQIARSVAEAGKMGVFACTLHASAGSKALSAAAAVKRRPRLWGVTVLTSFGAADLTEIGVRVRPADQVKRLAAVGATSGLDGFVCSPLEAASLRRAHPSVDLVTPGITFGDRVGGDQTRTAGPEEAWNAGADFIVVGRAVLEASDPAAAVRDILALRRASHVDRSRRS